jgi:hypothetical protein
MVMVMMMIGHTICFCEVMFWESVGRYMESKPMPEANTLAMMRLSFWATKKYS